jgi:hypothetical protein
MSATVAIVVCNRGAGIKIVGFDDKIADLHRDIQHHAVNGGTD